MPIANTVVAPSTPMLHLKSSDLSVYNVYIDCSWFSINIRIYKKE
jgi:hypothetical protein